MFDFTFVWILFQHRKRLGDRMKIWGRPKLVNADYLAFRVASFYFKQFSDAYNEAYE